MSVYLKKGGQTWYLKFMFRGRLYRESTHVRDKELALKVEAARKRAVYERLEVTYRPFTGKTVRVVPEPEPRRKR